MELDRPSAQDAALWCAQTDDAPLQIGALCLFEGAPLRGDAGLRTDDLRRHLEAGIHRIPRFRQKLTRLPLGLGLLWIDDQDFDVARHVRVAELPAPGDDAALRNFVSRLIEEPLDPDHPLWEMWLVDGISGDRVAVVAKASHVMADGTAMLDLGLSLLDFEPSSQPAEPSPWTPAPAPAPAPLLLGAALDQMMRQAGALWQIARQVLDPRHLLGELGSVARMGRAAPGLRAPALPINRPVGAHRDFTWVRLPWEDLDRVKRATGAKLNDVVLAVVARALDEYLERSGDRGDDRPPRVLVPASTHGGEAAREMENRFSLMVADLPVGVADPLESVRLLHCSMDSAKESSQTSVAPMIFALADLVPQAVLALIGPFALQHQPFVNLAVTNLPGTRDPMYLLGARLLELYPYVGVTGNIAVIVGVLSYGDGIHLGVTVDSDVVEDLDVLVDALRRASESMVDAVPSGEPVGRQPRSA